jgi:hypothetical protein
MRSKQGSKKEFVQSVEASTVASDKRRRRNIKLVSLAITVSLSIAISMEIGFSATFPHGYTSTTDLYKHSVCLTKVLDLSQKGEIRDAGGFTGAIDECMQMTSPNSIYQN